MVYSSLSSSRSSRDNIAKAPETPRLVDKKDKLVILIAEDNESNYKLFETILKKNYTLIHAWDGEEAVQLFKQHNPHLVLMDINMPKMDGYEATQKIREISPDVPVMAITAFAYAEDEQHILNVGSTLTRPNRFRQNNYKNKSGIC